MRPLRLVSIAIPVAAVAATAALAAPNHSGTVSQAASYAWDGGPVSGANETASVSSQSCSLPASGCDFTLLHTTEDGQLTVRVEGPDDGATDIDLYLYASDKDGKQGDALKSSTGSTATESVVYDAPAGYYLAVVSPASAANAMYKGKATLGPTPADPPPIDFGPDPTPSSSDSGTAKSDLAPTTKLNKPRKRPVKVLSGSARDADGHVAYVDVAVVRVKGKTCSALNARGKFARTSCKAPKFIRARGTKAWHLTLKHALPRGTYRLYARATDNVGRVDAGFGKANSRTLKIR